MILLFFIIYIASIFLLCEIYDKCCVNVTFWAVTILLTPIINTIFCIKYRKKLNLICFGSYKEFIKELNNEIY